jgi:serine/threonine protein kinase HipA of HipAB toxin-antitoxin module
MCFAAQDIHLPHASNASRLPFLTKVDISLEHFLRVLVAPHGESETELSAEESLLEESRVEAMSHLSVARLRPTFRRTAAGHWEWGR